MQIPIQQIVEGIFVGCSVALLLLKNNGILKEVKSNKLLKQFGEQRLDLLKITIYLDSIPTIDKLFNFNEYIASGGNHGVIDHMKSIIFENQDDWWGIYEREKDKIVTDENYRNYYNGVIAELKTYLIAKNAEKDRKDREEQK